MQSCFFMPTSLVSMCYVDTMLAIFMMAIDGIRNLIVMIPLILLLVWLKNWLNS